MAKLIRCPKCGQRVTWIPSSMILTGTKKETCGCGATLEIYANGEIEERLTEA